MAIYGYQTLKCMKLKDFSVNDITLTGTVILKKIALMNLNQSVVTMEYQRNKLTICVHWDILMTKSRK